MGDMTVDALYSVEAMITEEGKNYKGTLDFYEDRCILHNYTKVIEEFEYQLSSMELLCGTMKVTFLDLYTKEKRYVQIKNGTFLSSKYIVEDAKVYEVLDFYNRFRWKVKEELLNLTDYNEVVMSYFFDNPYCILGIPSNSSGTTANNTFEKLKKLDRLQAIASYRPELSIAGFPPVKRNLAICQNALSGIKDISIKWFWFDSAFACENWQFKSFRDNLTKYRMGIASYDCFLAQYLYVLNFDSNFEQRNAWDDIFSFYEYVVGERHTEVLRAKLSKEEQDKYNDKELENSFVEHIFRPLNYIAEKAEVESLLNFYRTIRLEHHSALKDYKRDLGGKIAQWVINKEKRIWSQIDEYIGLERLDLDAITHIRQAAKEYDEAVQGVLENVLSALTKEPLRAEMVKTSYCKVMQQVMLFLLADSDKTDAIKYGRYLYKYADHETKFKILATCGFENFPEAIADLPELVKVIQQTTGEKKMDTVGNFKDITICEGSEKLPRIEFCGLRFHNGKIGLHFWISNKSNQDLKFWLMRLEVNGENISQTEILCNVEQSKYDFYDYEIVLPATIRYYSVNQIEFYVEVDQPGNETIFDTNIIKIKCDTAKEIFMAEYE